MTCFLRRGRIHITLPSNCGHPGHKFRPNHHLSWLSYFVAFHSPGKRRSSTSKWALAFSFLVLFTSFFAHNSIILRYIFFIPNATWDRMSVEFRPLTDPCLILGTLDERLWRIDRIINGRGNWYTRRNPYPTATEKFHIYCPLSDTGPPQWENDD